MTDPTQGPQTLAAVDLGSNSFRMVIARVVDEGLQLIDRLREGVRLAGYLDAKQRLSAKGRRRALACLERFGQRLRDIPDGNVRAVGTNTLRKARNRGNFLEEAEEALGHRIDVVSGQEEARLIYLGVSHSLSDGRRRRLVVDIGGGSTECIVGEDFESRYAESLYMGCVGYTLEYFPGGEIHPGRMRRAEIAARLELRSAKTEFQRHGWDSCVGSSGTVLAIAEILRVNGWSDQGITPRGLRQLRRAILETGHVEELAIKGLRKDRARVLPGGVAILSAVFDSLKIERMTASSGAMREGVLYDLLGRIRHVDVRNRTIQRFVEQYRVDEAQAKRVERTALHALEQIAAAWELDLESSRLYLGWAARLLEIGLSVAHGGFHKHGAYLLDHSDMPGFSFQDQRLLSLLVRGHRRKFPLPLFEDLPQAHEVLAKRLCVLLRLACVLNRSRSPRQLPDFRLKARGHVIKLGFPAGWLDAHPLTRADLEQEASFLEAAGFKLKVKEMPVGD